MVSIFIVKTPESPVPAGAIRIVIGPGKEEADDWVVINPIPVVQRFLASADPADLLDQSVLRRLYKQALEKVELKGHNAIQLMIRRVMEGKVLALRPARPKDLAIVTMVANMVSEKTGCGTLAI